VSPFPSEEFCTGTVSGFDQVTINENPGIYANFEMALAIGNSACFAYTIAGNTNQYGLKVKILESFSYYVFEHSDTIHTPINVNKNYDGKDNNNWCSCHCPGPTKNWRLGCDKDGFTCNETSVVSEPSGMKEISCSFCSVTNGRTKASGCFTSSKETDFESKTVFDTKQYMIYSATAKKGTVITLNVEYYVNGVLTAEQVNPVFDLAPIFSPVGTLGIQGGNTVNKVTLQNEIQLAPNFRVFFKDGQSYTKAQRENFENLYTMPDEYVGIWSMEPDLFGFISGFESSNLKYDRQKLDEHITEGQVIKKCSSSDCYNYAFFADIERLETEYFQLSNILPEVAIEGSTTDNVFGMKFNESGIIEGIIAFNTDVIIDLIRLDTPDTLSVNQISCGERTEFSETVSCSVSYTCTGKGVVVVFHVGSETVYNGLCPAGVTTKKEIALSTNVFFENEVTLCLTSGSKTTCAKGKSTFIGDVNPLTDPKEEKDQEMENTKDDSSTSLDWWVIIIITIVSLVGFVLILWFMRKCMWRKWEKMKTRWKYKSLKENNELKELEQKLKEVSEGNSEPIQERKTVFTF
jgi:hypothetical protein